MGAEYFLYLEGLPYKQDLTCRWQEVLFLLIIIPVIAAIIIITIIIIFVVYHKKKTKSVSPKDDGTERSDDISHSQKWPAMTSGSKTELLASDM
jgi:hypothetical protein